MKIIKFRKFELIYFIFLLFVVVACQNNDVEIENKEQIKYSIKGKRIVWFGDSIIEDAQGTKYLVNEVATLTGATIYNQGYGGCRMAKHTPNGNGPMYDKMCMYRIVDYIDTNTPQKWQEFKDNAYDLVVDSGDDNRTQANELSTIDFSTINAVIISFGTNDYASEDGVPIGINSDTEGNTFKGALNKIILKLKAKYPNIQLVFTTPLFRSRYHAMDDGFNSDDYINPYGLKLIDYSNAIKEICNLRNISYLDMNELSGINKTNSSNYLLDGLHPNEKGCILLSTKYTPLLEKIIK